MITRRLLLLGLLCAPLAAEAHGGRLNSAGCHSSKRGGYHCHRTRQRAPKPAPKPASPPKKPTPKP